MKQTVPTLVAVAILLSATPLAAQDAMEATGPEVTTAVVAAGVEDREPAGASDSFTVDVGTLYFYTVFEGDFDETEFEHVWIREGEELARVALTARGPRWRTWSSKEILPEWTGDWAVKVVDGDGTEHASASFTLTEGM